jgi:putative copper export protein
MTWDGPSVFYAAARWLDYLAAFLFIGVVVFRLAVWPRAARRAGPPSPTAPRLGRLLTGVALVLLAALAARLYLQARSLADPDEPITREFLGLVLGTTWGKGWTAQAVVALLGLIAAGLTGIRRAGPLGWGLAALVALGVAGSASWTGHAVAIEQAGRYGWLLDAAHFGAGATWLGTLVVVVLVGLAPTRSEDVGAGAMVAAFSPIALASGLATMAAGVIMGYRYLGGVSLLFTPGYGRTLLIKLLVLALVAGLGAYHWRVALPRLQAAGDAGPLRKTAVLETAAAAALLAVTAILVSLPLPGEH